MSTNLYETITSDQFIDRVVVPQEDALVKISTAWSGAGQMLCHTLKELATEYSGKVNFYSVEHEADSELTINYRVDTIPTLLFFKKGTLVDKLSGLTHRHIIADKINQLVNA